MGFANLDVSKSSGFVSAQHHYENIDRKTDRQEKEH